MSSPPTTPARVRGASPAGGMADWPAWRVVLATALGTALVVTCCFSPRFWLWPVAGLPLGDIVAIQPEFHRAFHALKQLADPWQRIDDPVNRVIEWRLFWPVVAHGLALPRGVYLALPHLGCFVVLGFLAALVWRATRAALPTVALTGLAATASWFFVSTGWLAYFDSWLVLALLLASFARTRWVLLAAAAVAPWIDERFILALPICVAVRAFGSDGVAAPSRRELVRATVFLCAGLVPYLAVRGGLELAGIRATSSTYLRGRPLLPAPVWVMGWGLWNGLRLGWVPIVLVAAASSIGRSRRAWLGLALLATGLNLGVADDVSRSASVAVPLLVATALLLWREQRARAQRLLPLLCAGNLLLPAQHIIAAPGTAAAWHSVPVLSLTAEWDRVQHPPDFANPDTYHRRSLDHLQSGNRTRARALNEIALRLDPRHARSIAQRGILLFLDGHRKEGLAELDRALARAPRLFDARMQRAAFRHQLGDPAGALADVREALQTMPADWPARKDAEQFERNLARQVGR